MGKMNGKKMWERSIAMEKEKENKERKKENRRRREGGENEKAK